MKIEFATVQMKSAKLQEMAKNYQVALVGDVRRSEVSAQWVELINAAIRVEQDKVVRVDFKAQTYYKQSDLPGYVSFKGYAVHTSDYSRYTYPDNYKFQKPVYKFVRDKGYAIMRSGFDKLITLLREASAATVRADKGGTEF